MQRRIGSEAERYPLQSASDVLEDPPAERDGFAARGSREV